MTGPDPNPISNGQATRPAIPFHRQRSARPGGVLGGMRIRMKLMLLHTGFSLGLAAILLIALRPAIGGVVEQAELNEARIVLGLVMAGGQPPDPAVLSGISSEVSVRTGAAPELGLPESVAAAARASPRQAVPVVLDDDRTTAVAFVPNGAGGGQFWAATVRIPEARAGVVKLYGLVAVALLAIYGLVAAALELFVLPQNVYGPIRRLLVADQALQQNRREEELVPESEIPADELGEIMRSRNESVRALRAHERALGEALAELERVATDLKRKNHLLEAARRNLADADRLASLGMMSAGIAHELNTPLAVLKGLVDRLNADPRGGLPPAQAALMLRVVGRLERLGESLLDFARVRPPRTRPTALRGVVEEAATLLRLDRDAAGVEFGVAIDEGLVLECDADRMLQVFVNLLRNAAEACRSKADGRVDIRAETTHREGRDWASITVTDNGPGIDPDMLSRLFEPFATTRLDAHGTGLGLAVAEGIVREHGGLILARNRPEGGGAIFEVVVPLVAAPYPAADAAGATPAAHPA